MFNPRAEETPTPTLIPRERHSTPRRRNDDDGADACTPAGRRRRRWSGQQGRSQDQLSGPDNGGKTAQVQQSSRRRERLTGSAAFRQQAGDERVPRTSTKNEGQALRQPYRGSRQRRLRCMSCCVTRKERSTLPFTKLPEKPRPMIHSLGARCTCTWPHPRMSNKQERERRAPSHSTGWLRQACLHSPGSYAAHRHRDCPARLEQCQNTRDTHPKTVKTA